MVLLESPLALAAVTFAAAFLAGVIPLWRKVADQQNLLTWLTGLAAGVLLASALLVAIPEGFEIAEQMEKPDPAAHALTEIALANLSGAKPSAADLQDAHLTG